MKNTVAIIGRPNVGKSTLFNRLVESKKAITSHREGTTRDRHYGVVDWCGRYFSVVDTGGYMSESEDEFAQQVGKQIQMAIEEAAVVLFMVDCQQGLRSVDKEVASLLRKSGKPILLVANKADNPSLDMQANEFYSLGFETIYRISATHGTGTGDLLDAVVEELGSESTDFSKEELEDIPKVAIIGKPNVGKSTLLNAFLNAERSIVSSKPHTTRSTIHSYYNLFGKKLIFIDTAGIRKKSQVKDSIEFYSMMRTLKAIGEADVCMLVLDAEKGLTDSDQQTINLVYEYKKGVVILINKWDIMLDRGVSAMAYKENIIKQLGNKPHIPILFASGLRRKKLYSTILHSLQVYEYMQKRIPTTVVNVVMLQAIEDVPPPVVKGKSVKIKYVTQLPTRTPTFAFFCNLPQYITPAYKRYLENKIQKHFVFKGTPITLLFKKK
ncbi:MAG: ribosome biogenesis GTPase Der [Bacteroidota bacterium]